ncbi:MAG: chitobiase/beta-hexosaminidase C-terminal domain-containing protein, partial [Fibrobacter sp.]|nr:chitobiase/beta-hexosaminidase C-terminal domain-containing protein [Fibrobacter sp.]
MGIKLFVFAFLIVFCAFGESEILINEIMPSNIDVIMDDINEFPDSWIELYNQSGSSVNINGMYISDDNTNPKKWQIDSSFVIDANGHIVFFLDEKDTLKTHANFKLDIKGGTVFLTANDGVTCMDSLTYNKMVPNISYGRVTDGGAVQGWFRKATPNSANVKDYHVESETVAPKPEFSVCGGVYSGAVSVALSVPGGSGKAKIYYTTDGSEPDELSQSYSEPLSFSSPTTLRAKVIDPACLPRPSTTQSYIITNRNFDLPVLSVTIDTSYLFDPHIGIFVWGENYTSQYAEERDYYKYRMNSNLFYDWRRPANIEYFDGKDHVQSVNQIGEIRISGGGSRFQHEQKSFIIYANKRFETKR